MRGLALSFREQPVRRLDDVRVARNLDLCWKPDSEAG